MLRSHKSQPLGFGKIQMNTADKERYERIRRETESGYGITLKDLAWLVRLVGKLDKPALSPQPSALGKPSALSKPQPTKGPTSGV
jgi:hypothetical protein